MKNYISWGNLAIHLLTPKETHITLDTQFDEEVRGSESQSAMCPEI